MTGKGRAPGSGREAGALSSHWEGEPVQVLERLWALPRLEVHRTIGSTNDRLTALAREGAETWSVVLAEAQTAGRGREGRSWHSPPGVGLWMSVLLPGGPEGGPPLGPILVGLAVARALDRNGVEPRLKWPNDLFVGRRKVGGVLCRSVPDGRMVAGIGVNVLQDRDDFPPGIRERAGSLASEAGVEPSRVRLVGDLLDALRSLFGERIPEHLDRPLAEEVGELDLLRGERVEVAGGVRGRAVGIARDGALRVVDPGGREARIVAGSVRRLGSGEAGSDRPETEETERGGGE